MDIEGLIENLETLSDTLKSKPLRESASLSDFESSYERFEAMLSDLRVVVQKSDDHDPEKLKTILENLQTIISELDEARFRISLDEPTAMKRSSRTANASALGILSSLVNTRAFTTT